MKIIADTNVLVRAFVDDNPAQSRAARASLLEAEAVVVGKHALCELAGFLPAPSDSQSSRSQMSFVN